MTEVVEAHTASLAEGVGFTLSLIPVCKQTGLEDVNFSSHPFHNAERVGFEPTAHFHGRQFSRLLP